MTEKFHPVTHTEAATTLGFERLVFFSDCVFAIAITLLTLEIRLQGPGGNLDDESLLHALVQLVPQYAAFLISFFVVGFFWLSHHRKFNVIVRYDAVLVRINLFLLLSIALVPFFASILSASQDTVAVVLYASSMTITALLSALTSWYALHRDRLVDPDLGPERRSIILYEPLRVAAVFALSILVAPWHPRIAMCTWILIIPSIIDGIWMRAPRGTDDSGK